MSAYAATYVTLGTLVLRTRAIDCTDWSDLLKVERRGRDRTVPGQPGQVPRPRVADSLRAVLPVRMHGGFDGNTWLGGDVHDRLYSHIGMLHSAVSSETLTFTWPSGSDTVACRVDEIGPASFDSPAIARASVSVVLLDGPLDLS